MTGFPLIILEFPYLWVPTIKGPQDDYEFFGLVLVSTVNSCSTFHSLFLQDLSVNCWFTMRFPLFQEQIAACHEFDGVRKEKERLTAAYLDLILNV